ncbi:MAG: hypothetical protein PHQ32_02380 [Firmicutes bacterium]|nr:hypothetical protein [Bacillota bacterium]
MTFTGDLLKINGNVIDSIIGYKVNRIKKWRDTETNMAGDMRATLIGIYPEIEIEINVCTQDQITTLIQLLDQPYLSVEWFDVLINNTHTAQYYPDNFDIDMLFKNRGLYKSFKVKLIPVSKR